MTESLRNVAVLVALGLGWGSTQPLGKIATTTGHGPFGLIFRQLVVCVLVLGGPLFYAVEANYAARFGTAGMDAVQAMFMASLVGLNPCLPLTLAAGQMFNPLAAFGRPEAALLVSSVVHGLCYAGYVWLAARAGAVFAAQCSYLVTVAGVFWAMALLGERLPPQVWVSLVLMLAGVALVSPRGSGRADAVGRSGSIRAAAAAWEAVCSDLSCQQNGRHMPHWRFLRGCWCCLCGKPIR